MVSMDWMRSVARTAASKLEPWCATSKPRAQPRLPNIGPPAIRNRGTVGGSIAFADPAAELPACLLALAGEVEIAGPQGRRIVHADHFFRGLFETALAPRAGLSSIR